MALPAPKGKGDAGLLIALGGPDKPGAAPADDEAAEGEAPAMGDVKQMASDDAFDAMKAGDRALFADALDRFVQACMTQ